MRIRNSAFDDEATKAASFSMSPSTTTKDTVRQLLSSHVARSEVPIQEAQEIIAITVGCGLAAFALGLVIVYQLYMRKHRIQQKENDIRKRNERDTIPPLGLIPPRDEIMRPPDGDVGPRRPYRIDSSSSSSSSSSPDSSSYITAKSSGGVAVADGGGRKRNMISYPPRIYQKHHEFFPARPPQTVRSPSFQPFETQQREIALSTPKKFTQQSPGEVQGNPLNRSDPRKGRYYNGQPIWLREPSKDEFGHDLFQVNEPLKEESADGWKSTKSFGQHDPHDTLDASVSLATNQVGSQSLQGNGSLSMPSVGNHTQPLKRPSPSSRLRGTHPQSDHSSSFHGTEFVSEFNSDCLHESHELSEMQSPFVPLSGPLLSSISPLPSEASRENKNIAMSTSFSEDSLRK